jgi:NitT/TauT family transport system permease protein
VLVMGRNPGRIIDTIRIDLPRPRPLAIRETPEFGIHVARIRHLFEGMGMLKEKSMRLLDGVTTSSRGRSVIVVLVSTFVLWQLAVMIFKPPVFIIPSPLLIFQEIAAEPAWYLRHTLFTLQACLLGFALALAIGVLAAVGIVYSRFLEHTLYTLLVSLNSIPKIALAPLFIIWMGTGISSKVAVSMLIALFSIVIDTVLGLRSVDPDAIDLSRSLRASPMQILFTIRFPNALPAMFAGMKVAISLALVGAIAGEFVASQVGLATSSWSPKACFRRRASLPQFFCSVSSARCFSMPWTWRSGCSSRGMCRSAALTPFNRTSEDASSRCHA